MADLKVALEELRDESSSGRLSVQPAAARPKPKGRWPMYAGAAAVLFVVAAAVWILRKPGQPMPPQTIVPLTTYAGSELYPNFSPDGNQVAFSWDGEKEDNFDIYIKLVEGGGTPVRLTTDPAPDYSPAWSPDGRSIAFVRFLKDAQAIMLIPPSAGPSANCWRSPAVRSAGRPMRNGLLSPMGNLAAFTCSPSPPGNGAA